MKRSLLLLAFMATFLTQAQEKPYNQWALDLGVGVNKTLSDFAPGYWQPTVDFPQASLGVRYMFNNRFGTRLTLGYQKFSGEEGESIDFDTKYYRVNLEGVANLGNMMNFSTWTSRFNVLGHAGGGYASMSFDAVGADEDNDQMLNWVVGLTPQLKLSDRISLNGDFSVIGNLVQNATYDGTVSSIHVPGTYNAANFNISAGISIALGDKEYSADFYPHNETYQTALDSIEERIVKVETDLIDTDQDGVADYLDREPNTVSGVAVNTKGQAVDNNENGIPDELESSLDARYAGKAETGRDQKVIEELLSEGYINVYFGFNSDQPETYSLWAINQLVTYFNDNPDAQAELQGYTDTRGNPEYNEALSQRRAESVRDILVAAGVDESRLTTVGLGEDDSVDDSSSKARQMVRKVTIRLQE